MKKKRSLAFSLGAIALVLTLITSSLTSGTLAKYTEVDGADALAIVAAWNFEAGTMNGSDIAPFTATVNVADAKYRNTTQVKPNTVAVDRIAPGVGGAVPFGFDLTGTEVAVKVDFTITFNGTSSTIDQAPSSLKFYVTDEGTKVPASEKTLKAMLTDGAYTYSYSRTYTVSDIASGGIKKMGLAYDWLYEDSSTGTVSNNDALDKTVGEDAFSGKNTIMFNVVVRATQVNPTTSVPTT